MMTIIDYYWPVLAAALLIGIATGILAFRPRGANRRR
jgi:hypothetical protein